MPELILPPYIDSTMRSCFVSCPHKFMLEFGYGLRPSGISIDLHAGGCFASAIEHVGRRVYGEQIEVNDALMSARAEYLMNWGDVVPQKDTPKNRERVWEAVEDYYATYPPLSDHVQPFHVAGRPTIEFTFAEPLDTDGFPLHPITDEPWLYSGRFDMLGQYRDVPCIKDEKTTTSISANWSEQWQLRAQLMGYIWACRRAGINISTVCIRGVGILKTKFTQVEAVIQFSDWELERWYEQLRRDISRLNLCFEESYWDWNLGESCNSYGGCQFRTVCTSPNEERWFDTYAVRRWNPLHQNPIEESSPCPDTGTGMKSPPSQSATGTSSDQTHVENFLHGLMTP